MAKKLKKAKAVPVVAPIVPVVPEVVTSENLTLARNIAGLVSSVVDGLEHGAAPKDVALIVEKVIIQARGLFTGLRA